MYYALRYILDRFYTGNVMSIIMYTVFALLAVATHCGYAEGSL